MDRTETDIWECNQGEDFDWEQYQYLCDIADYWDTDE